MTPTQPDIIAAHRDRLEIYRLIGRSLGHHSRNYLSVAVVCGEEALGPPEAERTRRAIERIRESARAVERRLEAYLRFLRAPATGAVDLAAAADLALELGAHALSGGPFTIARALAPAPARIPEAEAVMLGLALIANVALLRPLDPCALEVSTGPDPRGARLAVEVSGLPAPPALAGALERPLADIVDARLAPPALAGARAVARAAGGDLSVEPTASGFRVEAWVPAAKT
jgi:hypothetical protein